MNELVTIIVSVAAIVSAVIAFFYNNFSLTIKTKSFNEIVNRLASDDKEAQLCAAILIRRFVRKSRMNILKNKQLRIDAINVISSILRVLPTGIYQKTLADGLAYAGDLTRIDLQKTNLQDIYLGTKPSSKDKAKPHASSESYPNGNTNHYNRIKKTIIFDETDFFMSDLSYALIENVNGRNAILYQAILFNANIKYSDFTYANFSGADLTNIKFVETCLFGANFTGAKGIPEELLGKLENGIYTGTDAVTTKRKLGDKKIFFSMPGTVTKLEEIVIQQYKLILENNGLEVIYYQRDHYPMFGQFNRVIESIDNSCGVIAFGFKQIGIDKGIYYGTHTNPCVENIMYR